MDDEVVIAHRPSCPVAQPDFKPALHPDGTVNVNAPTQCNCDLFKRLKAYLEDGEILP